MLYDIFYFDMKYEDGDGHKRRPVLVVKLKDNGEKCTVAKMTGTPPREGYKGEILLSKWKEAGLKKPTTVRLSKSATLKSEWLTEKIGTLTDEDIEKVKKGLKEVKMEKLILDENLFADVRKKNLEEGKKGYVGDLPDTLYEFVYDRLFPEAVKSYKSLVVDDNREYEDDRFISRGLGDYDIGVSVKDEEDASLVKDVADALKLKYEFRPFKQKEGYNAIAIIRMTDEQGETPTEDYLKKIGFEGKSRNKTVNKDK